jgi:hypothetical protein
MKKLLTGIIALILPCLTFAQKKNADTVVVDLAKTSRVVFTIRDKSDLEQLKQYDFQALFNDILAKLKKNDSVSIVVDTTRLVVKEVIAENQDTWPDRRHDRDYNDDDDDDDDDDNDDREWRSGHYSWRGRSEGRHRGTTQSFNFDLGINSFLEEGKFPDAEGAPYAVRPWGSWYVAINSVQRTRVSKNFFVEWGLGVSWYNFKFENDATLITKDDDGLTFEEDLRDVSFIKSKLTVSYVNASIIPMFDVGSNTRRYHRMWRSYSSAFRIGAGPYAGYRIGSYSKQVYKEDGDREKDRNRDNFYLNNLRYGVRLQIGVRSADFFFNYDLNELFATNKGPKLNAFSFGVTF